MNVPAPESLIGIQQRCCVALFDSQTFRTAPGTLTNGDNAPPRMATDDERRAVHATVEQGIRWLATNRPDHLSRRTWERFSVEAQNMAESAIALVCGVGVIVAALLSWLIGQALTWLWNWFKTTRNAPQLVCGMVG